MNVPTTASFKRLIISALIVPVALMFVIAAVLAVQIKGLMESAQAVEQSDQVIAAATELDKLYVDLESGLRGYLLTADRSFLEPFVASRQSLDRKSADLRQMLASNPKQLARLDKIDGLRADWLAFADRSMAALEAGGDHVAESRARVGKRLMDVVRSTFADLIAAEVSVRDDRSRTTRRVTRNTLLSVAGMTLCGGVLLAWLARRQFMELASTYQTALDHAHHLTETLEHRVTERTRQVEERSSQLAEANQELEAFAYSISHDLRAPMRHISGFAGLLKKSAGRAMSPDDKDNLDIIHDTARNAGRMVDDLLALSRIGRQQLKKGDVDLNEIVRGVIRDLGPDTQGRQIDWKIDPLPPAYGDPALLRMVLHNLLANAVKYTGRRAHATIEVGATTDGDDVTYYVRDNGEGFDMQYVHKLFGVFQRLHRTEEFEGTGIGLANVRRIIIRHGGRVWAEGKIGHGATFFFTLPLTESRTAV